MGRWDAHQAWRGNGDEHGIILATPKLYEARERIALICANTIDLDDPLVTAELSEIFSDDEGDV